MGRLFIAYQSQTNFSKTINVFCRRLTSNIKLYIIITVYLYYNYYNCIPLCYLLVNKLLSITRNAIYKRSSPKDSREILQEIQGNLSWRFRRIPQKDCKESLWDIRENLTRCFNKIFPGDSRKNSRIFKRISSRDLREYNNKHMVGQG